ncbi:MAG: hypothetical protein HKN23_13500 [Verrucomicrobiales bacterium]|nr:hypothetical protein [Verrucomicrobiales bacterium]
MKTATFRITVVVATLCFLLPDAADAQSSDRKSSSRWSFGKLNFSRYIKSRSWSLQDWFGMKNVNHNLNSNSVAISISNQYGPVRHSLPRRFPHEFRTIDGHGNNRANPDLGAAETPFLRLVPNDYADGQHAPTGGTRPSARLISNAICAQVDSIPNKARASDFLWQWGQFLDHDLDETPGADPLEPFNIAVPHGDPFFDPFHTGRVEIPLNRSGYVVDANHVRQQVNEITSVIDASNVYGSTEERAKALRTLDGTGKLKTSGPEDAPLLPFNVEGLPNAGGPSPELFLAGDVRANEQLGLTAMHTLFVREHNFWADKIAKQHRHLSGDEIYEKARIIVAAEMQAITYREFLPLLLGRHALRPYRGYDPSVDPSISNLFATAAYRVGHTMLSPELKRLGENGQPIEQGNLPLQAAFFRPDELANGGGIDPLLRGLASQPAQQIDTQVIDSVRNFLFGPPGAGGFDLASLNIQRGREHGLPDFNTIRSHFGLSPCANFSEYNEVEPGLAARLEKFYGTPDEMDPWIGLLGERHVHGALVGETLRKVLADQFTRLRDGDRFWYQHYLDRTLQRFIERQTLAVIIRRNTDIRNIQEDVFRLRGYDNRPSGPVRMRPDDFSRDHNLEYFGPDMTFRRWKDYGFGNHREKFTAILKQASPTVNGTFAVEINSGQAVKKSDIEVVNGIVNGISSAGDGRFFATVTESGSGPVSVSLGDSKVEARDEKVSALPTNPGENAAPALRPETYAVEVSTEKPGYLTFSKKFRKPVVFATVEKAGDSDTPNLVVRLDELTPDGVTVRLAHHDAGKTGRVSAKVRVLVLGEGVYGMGEHGARLEVGTLITRGNTELAPRSKFNFPVAFSQVQTTNSDKWVASTCRFGRDGRMKFELHGDESPDWETIGYVILDPRQGRFLGMPYEAAIRSPGSKTIHPNLRVGNRSGVLLSVPGALPAIRLGDGNQIRLDLQKAPDGGGGYLIIGD